MASWFRKAAVAQQHPEDFILMVLDGAGWHRVSTVVVPENMRLLPLPPHSPQLNPTEPIWDEVRAKWFANTVFDALDGVEDRLDESLVYLDQNQSLLASITGFDWIISFRLNAH
jgi:hypothetical protein